MTGDVTRLLRELGQGDEAALPALVSAVQNELRALAARHLAGERPDHTLQPTALVNEAFLKLVDQLEEGLVHQGRRLERVVGALARQVPGGQGAQLVLDRGHERGQRRLVALAELPQEPGDVSGHGRDYPGYGGVGEGRSPADRAHPSRSGYHGTR